MISIFDPLFWLGMVYVMFLLGGKASPLWTSKWYRKFCKSIGLVDNSDY